MKRQNKRTFEKFSKNMQKNFKEVILTYLNARATSNTEKRSYLIVVATRAVNHAIINMW